MAEMTALDGAPLVLIADDRSLVRELVADILADAGLRTAHAPDGETVVELARLHAPALILLDILMPKADGYATLLRLRGDPVTRDIPVITVSGYDEPSFAVLSRETGAAAHLAKPFSPAELTRTVGRVLDRVAVVAA